jgi:hypothetical protein
MKHIAHSGPTKARGMRRSRLWVMLRPAVPVDYGTAIIEHIRPMPVMWAPGYIGRQSGSDVEILDTSGQVVARTESL